MPNPYETLYIYYFQGIPLIDEQIEKKKDFLGCWEDDGDAFLFFSTPHQELADGLEDKAAGIHLIDSYEMTGDQWHGDKIEPYLVNDLCICPPWQQQPPDYAEAEIKKILLDPGVVFGTGRHQTTEDCLDLIHRLCTRKKIESVLDVGTGTGLLALGAAALGCRKILACDFNLLASRTAWRNVRLNGFEDRVLVFQAKGEEIMGVPCDLLVANIHYDVMQYLIESPAFRQKKWMILSGLLRTEARKIMDKLKEKKIHVVEHRCLDNVWHTILARPMANPAT